MTELQELQSKLIAKIHDELDKEVKNPDLIDVLNHLLATTTFWNDKAGDQITGEWKMKPNHEIIQIAKVCHNVNKAYCESIGDNSQPTWEEAPEWQKESAINGVKFHFDNPLATPEESHNSWLKEKKKAGWKYGAVKDTKKKTHPCFVPYDFLPEDQKAKDALFIAVVNSFD